MYTFKDAIQEMYDTGEIDRCCTPEMIQYYLDDGWTKEAAEQELLESETFRDWIEETIDDDGTITIPTIPLLIRCVSVTILQSAICFMQLNGQD